MPRPVMEAMLARTVQLQAEEALLLAQIALLPYQKTEKRRRAVRDWMKLAQTGTRRVFTALGDFKAWLAEQGLRT